MPSERLPFAPERSAASAHLPDGAPTPFWRRLDRLVLVVTLLGLLVPWGMLLAGFRPRPIENRPLARLPAITVTALLDGSWFRGADAFLSDNVWVRPYAIRIRGEAYWRSGGTGNPEVLRGTGNWLFTREEFEPTCRTDATQVLSAVQHVADVAAASGMTFRFLVIPDKHDIYPEHVGADPFPPACTEPQRAPLRAGIARLGPLAVDSWTVLTKARADDPQAQLYYAADTHWTPLGAAAVVRALVRSIDPGVLAADDLAIKGDFRRSVDLADQIGIHRVETTPRVVRPGVTVTRTDVASPDGIRTARAIFETTATGQAPTVAGRTLILYDSFFGIDVGVVAPCFADAVWVHIGDITSHPELASRLGPFKTVVFERVERAIYASDLNAVLSGIGR